MTARLIGGGVVVLAVIAALYGVVQYGRALDQAKLENEALQKQIEQYKITVAKMDEIRGKAQECLDNLETVTQLTEEWERRYQALDAEPPDVRTIVEYIEREPVGETVEDFAAFGARIASDAAAELGVPVRAPDPGTGGGG